MTWNKWVERWELALAACSRLGGNVYDLTVSEPATESAVTVIEQELHLVLPSAFRQTLTQFSAEVDFQWSLPDELKLPDSLRGIFSGECAWSLQGLAQLEERRKGWITMCFTNSEDEYDKVWHNKLAFLVVANGDMLALDLAHSPAPVVYLSHDGGEGHGYRLGADFIDFIDRWTLLGCPGAEDWQMLPFLTSPNSFLNPYGENAELWRSVFGLPLVP